MWLLNTTTLTLCSFFDNIPDYVILSHTWGDGEVAFEDIAQPHAQKMVGYDKIIGCCRLAVNDSFEWAWIDTCCIRNVALVTIPHESGGRCRQGRWALTFGLVSKSCALELRA
jgi:hypothetical protein